MKIERLTPDQQSNLAEFRKECFRLGSQTKPCDRGQVESAISEMYEMIERDVPRFIWCDSPATCSLMVAFLRKANQEELGDSLRGSLGGSRRGSLGGSLGG